MSKLKLLDVIILGLSFVFIVIGIDQSIYYGFNNSYWAFMLALTLFFTFTLRKGREKAENQSKDTKKHSPRKPGSRR